MGYFTDFCVLLLLLCFKNPLYYPLLQFRLLAPVLCSATSSDVDDPTYIKPLYVLLCSFKKRCGKLRTFVFFCFFCVSKKSLYGLLCSFVTFVFQKKCSTDFCVLLLLLCFKKMFYGLLCTFVTFVFQKPPLLYPFAISTPCSRIVFRDIVGRRRLDVRYFCFKKIHY